MAMARFGALGGIDRYGCQPARLRAAGDGAFANVGLDNNAVGVSLAGWVCVCNRPPRTADCRCPVA